MNTPLIPISWGELFDKITILQIKLENLKEKNALKNVKLEHDQLFSIFNHFFLENTIANELINDRSCPIYYLRCPIIYLYIDII